MGDSAVSRSADRKGFQQSRPNRAEMKTDIIVTNNDVSVQQLTAWAGSGNYGVSTLQASFRWPTSFLHRILKRRTVYSGSQATGPVGMKIVTVRPITTGRILVPLPREETSERAVLWPGPLG